MEKSDFKILVAEDDAIVRDVIVKFLSEEGYHVAVAHDGLAAIKFLRLEYIKLVLTDLRMPGADGMEVLRTAMQIDPKIAVVVITAYGTLDTALDAMNEGAYDYIVKPFVMQQLLLTVRNAYKMVTLIEENEKLTNYLRETYRDLETIRSSVKNKDITLDSMERIKKLKELSLVNTDEDKMFNENIKKYCSMISDLKANSE